MITMFDTLEDVLMFIENEEYSSEGFFKVEIYRTEDHRYRVGVSTVEQMEMNFDVND